MITRALVQHVFARQQAMNAGDSHVVQVLNLVAHDLRRDHCFFGDRNVAGAGGDDDDLAFAANRRVLCECDAARERVKLGFAQLALHCTKLLFGCARRQHIVTALCQLG